MTAEEVKDYVEKIRGMKDDPEMAHFYEDYLRQRVLQFIAADENTPKAIAELVTLSLSTSDIDFPRWCA